MTNFLLLFIAVLLSFDMIMNFSSFLDIFAPLVPLYALIIACVISLIYWAIKWIIRMITAKNSEYHGHTFYYDTGETEEEKRARVNAEVDKWLKK